MGAPLVRGGPLPAPTDAEAALRPAIWLGRSSDPTRVVVLGEEMLAVPTHWADGRTRVCWAPRHCGYCATRRTRRPQYHLACWDRSRGIDVVLCLGTAGAAALIEVAQREEQLRGLDVVLAKLKEHNRSRVVCSLEAKHDPTGNLRAAFALRPHLLRMFDVDTLPTWDGGEGEVS